MKTKTTPHQPPAEKVEHWPIAKVLVSERNTRQPQPTDPDVKSLAVSLAEQGQTTPGIARPHPKKTGCLELGAGARRRTGLALIGTATMAVIVRKLTDAELDSLILVENFQRLDPHPREEAKVIARLVAGGLKPPAIAAQLGKDTKWVNRRLQLLKIIPAIFPFGPRGLF